MLRSSCRRNEAVSGGEAVVNPENQVYLKHRKTRFCDGYAIERSLRQLLRED